MIEIQACDERLVIKAPRDAFTDDIIHELSILNLTVKPDVSRKPNTWSVSDKNFRRHDESEWSRLAFLMMAVFAALDMDVKIID